MDRHVATRQFELRRLYVALRVRVEVESGAELTQSSMEAIEERRNQGRMISGFDRGKYANKIEMGESTPLGHRLGAVKRLIVLGDPGAGKTTMLRWIATAYLLRTRQDQDWKVLPDVLTLPDQNWLLIMVRCRDLDHSILNQNLDAMLHATLVKAELTEIEANALRHALRDRLKLGKALLLIDGLDEISDLGVRMRFCQQLEQIHLAYPDAPIVVTSRIVGYREMGYRIGRGFEHVTVADLTKSDKDDFARRWSAITEQPERVEAATEELIQDIHCTDRIERLTVNPMLLTTMALVKRKVGRLPSRRVDLYWDAFNVLLNWRREIDDPMNAREAIPQLEYVAFAMCDRGVQKLREDEIIDLFENMRSEYPQIHAARSHSSEEFLKLLERRTGILIEAGFERHQGRPVSLFEFRHLTFQEYIAGRALVDGRFPGRIRSNSLADNVAPLAGRIVETEVHRRTRNTEVTNSETWREVLRLCVSSCNDDDVDSVFAAILNPAEGEDPSRTSRPRTVLAALCLADEPNLSEETAQHVLQRLVEHISTKDGSQNLYTGVDMAIKEIANTRWSGFLLSMLVASFANPARQPNIIKNNVALLSGLVASVVNQRNSISVDWQILSETNDPDPKNLQTLLSHLFDYGYKCLFANDSKERPLRVLAPADIDSLLAIGSKFVSVNLAISWALRAVSHYDSNQESKAIERLWEPTPYQISWIMKFVSDKSLRPSIVINWLHAVANAGCVVEGLEIIERLNDTNERVVEAAIRAIGRARDARCVPALISKLAQSPVSIKMESISSLGRIGDRQAVIKLIELLQDEDTSVCRSAALALGELGDVSAVTPLLSNQFAGRGIDREIAVSLGMLANETNIDSLKERLIVAEPHIWRGFKSGLFKRACEYVEKDEISGVLRNIKTIISKGDAEGNDFITLMFCNILVGDLEAATMASNRVLSNRGLPANEDCTNWGLCSHNLGVLAVLSGEIAEGVAQFQESLNWWEANPDEDPSSVVSVLVLLDVSSVTHKETIPVDVASLVSLYRIKKLQKADLEATLVKRYANMKFDLNDLLA